MNDPASKRSRIPILKVRSKCASDEQLVVQFRKDLDPRGIFIKTRKGLPVGTRLRFEYLLEAGEPVLAGSGTVAWTRDATSDEGPAGMAVTIEQVHMGAGLLDRASEERRGTRSRYERGLPRAGSSLPPPTSSLPPSASDPPQPSLRPTAPPPEIELAPISLPPDEAVSAPPAAPIDNAMPEELDAGIFRGVGPAPDDHAHEPVEAAIAASQRAPQRRPVDVEAPARAAAEAPPSPPKLQVPSGPVALPERPTDWLGPAVGLLFALFVAAALYVAIAGGLPEPLQQLLFSE